MKILLDGRLYGLENAGLGRYLINLVSELAKIDSKNTYIILLRRKYFSELSLPSNWRKVLADFRHYSFAEQIRLPWIIKNEAPDIVHFPHFNVPIFFGGSYVVTIHDMLMNKFQGLSATTLPAPLYFIKTLVYKLVFKRAVLGARKIIVPSKAVKIELLENYNLDPRKLEMIYEGFDRKISDFSKTKFNRPYFVYTGNAYPHKNLNRLIESIINLNKKSNQKVLLAIASARNIFTQRLKKVIDQLKANEFVKLLGFVPDEELGGLYKHSIGFVFPSLSEGFGLPGLEAMSVGTLVLASDIPVFREIYESNAIYFNPLDISSIEKSMQNALSLNENEREQKIDLAKKFVKRYSWAKMAKATLNLYEKEGSNSLRSG